MCKILKTENHCHLSFLKLGQSDSQFKIQWFPKFKIQSTSIEKYRKRLWATLGSRKMQIEFPLMLWNNGQSVDRGFILNFLSRNKSWFRYKIQRFHLIIKLFRRECFSFGFLYGFFLKKKTSKLGSFLIILNSKITHP